MKFSKLFLLWATLALTIPPISLAAMSPEEVEGEHNLRRSHVRNIIEQEAAPPQGSFSSFRKVAGNGIGMLGDFIRTEDNTSFVGQVKEVAKNYAVSFASKQVGFPLSGFKKPIFNCIGNGLQRVGRWIKGGGESDQRMAEIPEDIIAVGGAILGEDKLADSEGSSNASTTEHREIDSNIFPKGAFCTNGRGDLGKVLIQMPLQNTPVLPASVAKSPAPIVRSAPAATATAKSVSVRSPVRKRIAVGRRASIGRARAVVRKASSRAVGRSASLRRALVGRQASLRGGRAIVRKASSRVVRRRVSQ